ncbi:MAG TPA: hypothetical protein VGI43_01640 [Mucilaginibacter sp.]
MKINRCFVQFQNPQSSSDQKQINYKTMKEFMMVYRNAGTGDFKPTPEQAQAVEKQWSDWFETIAD